MGKRPLLLVSANSAWNLVNFRLGLLNALIENGFALATAAPPDPESECMLRSIGCTIHHIAIDPKGLSPLKDLATIRAYWHLMRKLKPAAYLGWTIKPNIYGALAARLAGIPSLLNVSGLGTAFLGKSILQATATTMYRIGFARADTVFFQNRSDRDIFFDRRLVRFDQAALIPGSGIDVKKYKPSDNPRGSGNRFLMIARLLGDKGVREYVEAAQMVRKTNPQCSFGLLGFVGVENRTAISRQDLDAWIASAIIDYNPPVSDVRPAIEKADCIVLPSYREGTSRVLLEAAAMGKPLIATNVPGCREIVEDGVNGFLCKARDSASLTEAMGRFIRLSDEKKRSMGQAGRAKIVAEFSEQRVIAAYLKSLSAALDNRPVI